MMNLLFTPAIKLMNALTFSWKFIVLGVLSLISLLVVSIFLTLHLLETIDVANQELEGLKQVSHTSKLIHSIQQHRGLSAAKIVGVSTNNNQLDLINQKATGFFILVNKTLPTKLKSLPEWHTINDLWAGLKYESKTLDPNVSFSSHTKLIKLLFIFQRNLADYYQLPIVRDLDSYYLTNSLLFTLPISLESLGQVRALGTSYLINKNTFEREKIKFLLSTIKLPIGIFEGNINKIEKKTTPDGKNIITDANLFVQRVEKHIDFIVKDILSDTNTIHSMEFYKISTVVIDSGYQFLETSLISTLDTILKTRVEQAKYQLLFGTGLLSILFLLVLYFLVGIYYSTIRSINSLVTITHDFYNGKLDERVTLSTNDELNLIAISFNKMADGFLKLLVDKEELGLRLRTIIDNSPIGIWFSGVDGRYYFVNQTFCDLVEINEETFLNTDLSHLADLLGDEISQNCLNSDRKALGQDFPSISYETIHRPNGETRFLEITKVKLKNNQGEAIGLIGISQDITEKRHKDEALKLAEMVYKNSSEAMMVTDQTNRIIAVNPALSIITGYGKHELINRDPKILSSGKQAPEFYQSMWEELTLTGSWQGEIWNTKKDGLDYIEWLSINTIYDDYGKVFRRIALFSDITEKKKADELILRQANYDDLTNLPNRRFFNKRLAQEIKKADDVKLPLALIFLGLDNFKEINDSHGHEYGDAVLIEAGKRIVECVQNPDTVARLGGDEYTVVLSELNDLCIVEIICQKILEALRKPFFIDEMQFSTSASLGVTVYPNDASTVVDLIKNVDQAMYLAKKLGRNQFCYFSPSMKEEAENRLELLNDLRQAINLGQLEVFYQPIVELQTGNIHKAEALLRWKHPSRGMVSPAEFIPLAEDSGLIVEIGDWVFKQVVLQIKRCDEQFDLDVQISVNKSPVQFREVKNHSDWFTYLNDSQISGKKVVIEITEGLLMDNNDKIMKHLNQFRDAGIEISLDDFGTGYSSLSYLKKFDIDYLKIDQAFTKELAPNSENMILSEAIIVMAHKLGLKVIAEGIETEEQGKLLSDMGCDYGQGYYFSKPVPEKEFVAILKRNL